MISILRQNPSAEALYRLVPYLSHGLYGFWAKTGVAYVSHFWQKACGLNKVFWKNGVAKN